MRALIVSDVHSNQEALEGVLEAAGNHGGFDQVWSLGDIVGYGPNPHECIDLLRSHNTISVAGNHDLAAVGKIDPEGLFNAHALAAIRWTTLNISYEDYSYLLGLPNRLEVDDFTLVHGSPKEPYWLEYVITSEIATASFELFETQRCLVGHSHKSFICRPKGDSATFDEFPVDQSIPLGNERMIINPGAVGQPRDRDPKASYVIYDSDAGTVTHHRSEYDVELTQAKMEENKLPPELSMRLAYGL